MLLSIVEALSGSIKRSKASINTSRIGKICLIEVNNKAHPARIFRCPYLWNRANGQTVPRILVKADRNCNKIVRLRQYLASNQTCADDKVGNRRVVATLGLVLNVLNRNLVTILKGVGTKDAVSSGELHESVKIDGRVSEGMCVCRSNVCGKVGTSTIVLHGAIKLACGFDLKILGIV